MTILPHTTRRLLAAGYDPQPLQRAANDNFMAVGRNKRGHLVQSGLYATDEVTADFWRVFCAAARVLRGGEEIKEAA